jgi:hypothetical protein
MAEFYTLLTNAGIAYETACKAAGVPIKLARISVGDGNGAVYNPDATAKSLKREVWRGPLNALFQDEKNPSWLLAEVTIPAEVGGWYVREAGLWTDTGILYAIVKYPESFKPVLATSGTGKEFYIRSIFETNNASLVTLLIDDTVVKATRAWVMGYVADELAKLDAKQSVRVATTTNITLSAPQIIDGVAVVTGDRVLVKNQTAAKDNGLYVVANAAWVRTKDADVSAKVTSAMTVSVEQGSTFADTIWQLVTDGTIVLGTTPLAFQNITQDFALRSALGSMRGYVDYSQSAVLTAADIGLYVRGLVTGVVLSLPDPLLHPAGSRLIIQAAASAAYITVTTPNSQFGGSNGDVFGSPSIKLVAGVSSEFVSTGTGWLAFGGSGTALLAASGYIKHPNGLIEQWVTGGSDANGVMLVSLPIQFPTAVIGGIANEGNPSGWGLSTVTVWAFDSLASTLSTAAARCRYVTPAGPSVAPGIMGRIRVWGK